MQATANIKDNLLLTKKLPMCDPVKIPIKTNARRACVFNFLASQQKVKKEVPLRSLRLERSGR
jgi:hypothetical protein